jgi:hypothetical protein
MLKMEGLAISWWVWLDHHDGRGTRAVGDEATGVMEPHSAGFCKS